MAATKNHERAEQPGHQARAFALAAEHFIFGMRVHAITQWSITTAENKAKR